MEETPIMGSSYGASSARSVSRPNNTYGINLTGASSKPHKHRRPVDLNTMKRNMSIAKGFMDISLLTANANQLRQLMVFGDRESYVFYVVATGLFLSLTLQIAVGVMLIIKERFDINHIEDHESAELYNNITTMFVFLTLLLNVFVSSFGVEIMHHPPLQSSDFPKQKGILARSGGGGLVPPLNLSRSLAFPP